MKKTIIFVSVAVLAGFLAGYFIFHKDQTLDTHTHDNGLEQGVLWTCSMHPQIRQDAPGNCPICGMALIPAEAASDGLALGQFRLTKNAMALADIRTTIVGSGSTDGNSLKLSGTIKENEKAVATQASYFDGRIEKLFVNFEGEEVRSGKQLASIYSPELVAAQQELITAAGLKETQPALYQAVRNKLQLWKLSEKEIEQIEKSGQVRENFPVFANVSGTVSGITVEAGDYVKQGAPLFKIANLNTVWAVFDAYENQVSRLREGQEITIVTRAYPDMKFDAKISFIDPVLNSATRTVKVRAVLQNPRGQLKPGMFVSGSIQIGARSEEATMVIPESAVLWTGERSVVYIRTRPGEATFEMREITLGDPVKGGYVVLSGLASGDEIVTNGTFTVDAAAQLKGKKSMMNREGSSATSHKGMGTAVPPMEEGEYPSAFQTAFPGVLEAYMELKDALVASDPKRVQTTSEKARELLNKLPSTDLGSATKNHLEAIRLNLNTMIDKNSLEIQRASFVPLSEHMIRIAAKLKNPSRPIYVQHCPMANSNQGADWLSWEKEIKNPYYGEAMLTCGEVLKTL